MLRAFRPIPYSKQCSPCLLAQPPLASGRCRRLCFFSAGSFHWACNLWVLIIYFSSWLCYLLWFQVSPDSPVRVFPGVWKLLSFLRLPSQDRSLSLPLLSLFLSFIFFPTSFRRQWAAFLGAWCPLLAFRSCLVEFIQRSNVLLMNLWVRKWSPHPIPRPS